MPLEMPRGLPFSVDTWTPSSKKKRHHFLTHAHKDHTQGISTHCSYPIYCTHLTKLITLQYYPKLDGYLFVDLEVGQSMVIDDPDGAFSVTAFDANHCPGAVMLLFEGNFGNILHTGDCRLTPECLQKLPESYVGNKEKKPRCKLDYVFLDCTFGKYSLKMPSKYSAIRQVISCIWKHPDARLVYLTCDLLGQEEILMHVSQTFGSKIFVDKDKNPECFSSLSLTAPEILSQEPSSRFQVFEAFPRLFERSKAKIAEARANFQPEPLIIRPSAQWYVCDDGFPEINIERKERYSEAIKDLAGVWHICYSMHSSREELEWALQLLAPKRVVSTTPNCRATELNYVRRYCFCTHFASDDPMWKLLDITFEASSNSDTPTEGVCCSALAEELPSQITVESQLQPVSINQKKLSTLSSPSKKPPVTLFGRARLGFPDSHKEKKIVSCKDSPEHIASEHAKKDFSLQEDVVEPKCNESLENQVDVTEVQCQKSLEKETELHKSACSQIGPSKSFNQSFRKLYRSMNVPVPEPLPSLMELMKHNKRPRRFQF